VSGRIDLGAHLGPALTACIGVTTRGVWASQTVCPVCGFFSAEHQIPKEPFVNGARVRCVGYPIVGAGTVVGTEASGGELIVQIAFGHGEPPRPDFAVMYGNDGSVGVMSRYLEPLFP
jgi:hypothetical protein